MFVDQRLYLKLAHLQGILVCAYLKYLVNISLYFLSYLNVNVLSIALHCHDDDTEV